MALPQSVVDEFRSLLAEATRSGDPEPTAMTLATSGLDGCISARTVLLKDMDERGFVFYTNFESNKGRQLLANPNAALLFLWKTLRMQVQVKVEGKVAQVSTEEADAYFASRPRESQIGAWASMQSAPLVSREALEERIAQFSEQYSGQEVPRPAYWSGFRLAPSMIEFWFGAPFRLHHRVRHSQSDGQWQSSTLFP